jgi:hypothetical protein
MTSRSASRLRLALLWAAIQDCHLFFGAQCPTHILILREHANIGGDGMPAAMLDQHTADEADLEVDAAIAYALFLPKRLVPAIGGQDNSITVINEK